MSIGKRIKELRKLKGISQAKLAEHIGVSAGNVGEWELERAKPGADALLSLSKYFGVSSDWILSGQEPISTQILENPQKDESITLDEMELIAKWRRLTERQKGRIEGHIEEMLGESPELPGAISSPLKNGSGREEAATKQSAG